MSTARFSDSQDMADTRKPPTREFLHHIEEQAGELRHRAGVGPLDPLDPREVADRLHLKVATPDDIEGLSPQERAKVRTLTPKQWSGTGIPLRTGELLVLFHPEQTTERSRVTTMEEAAHEHYGHEPTRISLLANGMAQRTFNPRVEQEAYWTAAAALLPMKAVGLAVWRGQTAEDLAFAYGVSVELAEFRIKILGLWGYRTRKSA